MGSLFRFITRSITSQLILKIEILNKEMFILHNSIISENTTASPVPLLMPLTLQALPVSM